MSDCSPLRLNDGDQSPPSSQSSNNHSDNDQTESNDMDLKYGAEHVIKLFIPVSLCMLIVVATVKATNAYQYTSNYLIWYAPFTDQTVDTGTRIWQSFANAFILLIFLVCMTCFLILLYKFSCYNVIYGWLILSSSMLLFLFTIMYIGEFLRVYNIPMDDYTMTILIWNIGTVGMACIHWKGPLVLQQFYLIIVSALMALVFIKYLPDWTAWTVLVVVSIWDLIAVLCPRGPLRILVETAQERNEPLFPSLIYSSAMAWMVGDGGAMASPTATVIPMAKLDKNRTRESRNTSSQQRPETSEQTNDQRVTDVPADIEHPPAVAIIRPLQEGTRRTRRSRLSEKTTSNEAEPHEDTNIVVNINQNDEELEEERGVKLGLGDFIFFSLLVGKVSTYNNWNITIACFVGILVGLCCTLALLTINRKALPALPIPVATGMIFFFLGYSIMGPFAEILAWEQVHV